MVKTICLLRGILAALAYRVCKSACSRVTSAITHFGVMVLIASVDVRVPRFKISDFDHIEIALF